MTTDARLRELYQRALATRAAPSGDAADAARARCPSPEAVLALVRREGPEEERLATLDHVMSCDACRRELDLLRAIELAGAEITGTGASADATHSRDRSTVAARWKRAVVPLALAASVLLAVGVHDRVGRRGHPSIIYETGEDEVVRGGNAGGGVTLLAPNAGARIAAGAALTFAWRPNADARRYVLEVLDAGGRVVLADTTADTTLALRDASRLTSGATYRWWVRAVGAGGAQRASALRALRVRSQ